MNNFQTTGGRLKSLRILYFAMLGATVMMAAIFYFVSQDSAEIVPELEGNILLITLVIATLAISISSFIWRKDIGNIQQGADSPAAKFDAYRAAAIKRYAFTEFAAIFSIIGYFLTKEPRLYVVVAILLIHFLTMFPASSKIASQIGESQEIIENL